MGDLRNALLGFTDSVYVPNETKDYTGVKATFDINELTDAVQALMDASIVEARLDERKQVQKTIHKEIGREWRLSRDLAGKPVEYIVKHCADYLLAGIEQDQKNRMFDIKAALTREQQG